MGAELPVMDDDWLIDRITDEGVHIRNTRVPWVTTLGYDQISKFTSDPNRNLGDTEYGFLILHIQVYLEGDSLWVEPLMRPGDPGSKIL
jgi:hypothetical protein